MEQLIQLLNSQYSMSTFRHTVCDIFVLLTLGHLLPMGSEEREVLKVESILVAILPSCQYMKNIAL